MDATKVVFIGEWFPCMVTAFEHEYLDSSTVLFSTRKIAVIRV